MAKKVVRKKPADPWGGASHGTPGFGVGSATALKAYTPPPDAAAGNRSAYDGLLSDARTNAGRGYDATVANSIADEGSTALDYGATLGPRDPNADPSTVTGGSYDWQNVDATNPFSKAALLVRNYKQQQNRTTNGLAAQGQLYSGAMANQRSSDTFGYQAGQDQLLKNLQQYLVGQARNRGQAAITRDDAVNQAGMSGLGSLLGGG